MSLKSHTSRAHSVGWVYANRSGMRSERSCLIEMAVTVALRARLGEELSVAFPRFIG
jgi:hypothetical protein